MTFGFRTWAANGTPVMTEFTVGGVFIGYISHTDSDPNSYPYPELAGKTLRVLQVAGAKFVWSVSYATGYPVIQISTIPISSVYDFGSALELLVFAT